MPNLRDIKKRVKSIQSTQQITKAMKMVSAAKLRRAQENITKAKPYADMMANLIASLALRTDPALHPLLEVREPSKKVAVLVLTSDRGICGSFNSNVLRTAENFVESINNKYEDICVVALSRKANEYFKKRNVRILKHYKNILSVMSYESALIVSKDITELFLQKELDEVYIVYSQFKSAFSQIVILRMLLPLIPRAVEKDEIFTEYIFEPSAKDILNELLEKHIVTQVSRSMLDSIASEHGTRMTSMDAATNNATDMIKKLTLLYNRARQATITKELVEIVSGAEALKS